MVKECYGETVKQWCDNTTHGEMVKRWYDVRTPSTWGNTFLLGLAYPSTMVNTSPLGFEATSFWVDAVTKNFSDHI